MIIPVVAGVVSWVKFHEIDLKESVMSVGAALLLISSTLLISKCSSRMDTETLSGRITSVHHTPEWEAEWQELETYTTIDSKGNAQTHTRLVTRRETHSPKWWAETTVGDISMSRGYFNHIGQKYGIEKEMGHRPNFNSGNRYDYYSHVNDDPEFCDYPVTKTSNWQNPLKNSKGLHSFKKISEEEALKMGLPNYPQNDPFKSSRLIGGVPIDIWNWDKMNAALGADYKVNLIMVKLEGGVENAKNLQAYWKNGKKNDIVMCYEEGWSYVFGWSETELVKLNLQTILLDNPVNDGMIPLIKEEIRKNFKPHKWTMYEEQEFIVPTWTVATAFILMILSQIGLYYAFHKN
jgi:hypothetical protein